MLRLSASRSTTGTFAWLDPPFLGDPQCFAIEIRFQPTRFLLDHRNRAPLVHMRPTLLLRQLFRSAHFPLSEGRLSPPLGARCIFPFVDSILFYRFVESLQLAASHILGRPGLA